MRSEIRPWLAVFRGERGRTEALAAGKIGGIAWVDAGFEARTTMNCACRGRPIAVVLR